MFLNGADYNVVNPFLWIYYNIFLCHINSVKGKIKTLTPSPLGIRVFNMMLGFRLHYILNTLHLWGLVTVQKYNEFPKHARNVNFVLTFGKRQNLRKIAAKENIEINSSLNFRTLKQYTKWNTCQWNTIGDFYCLPPWISISYGLIISHIPFLIFLKSGQK